MVRWLLGIAIPILGGCAIIQQTYFKPVALEGADAVQSSRCSSSAKDAAEFDLDEVSYRISTHMNRITIKLSFHDDVNVRLLEPSMLVSVNGSRFQDVRLMGGYSLKSFLSEPALELSERRICPIIGVAGCHVHKFAYLYGEFDMPKNGHSQGVRKVTMLAPRISINDDEFDPPEVVFEEVTEAVIIPLNC